MSKLQESVEKIPTFIEKVDALLKAFKTKFSEEKKFKDAKLKDGTIVRYEGETPVAGIAIMVVSESGEMPAPNGEHELEDGSVVVVEDGKIKEVKAKVEEAMNDDSEKMKAENEALKSQVAELLEIVKASGIDYEAMKSESEKIKSDLEANKKEVEKVVEELKASKQKQDELISLVEKIVEAPAAEPTATQPNAFASKHSIKDQKKAFWNDIKNLRKS